MAIINTTEAIWMKINLYSSPSLFTSPHSNARIIPEVAITILKSSITTLDALSIDDSEHISNDHQVYQYFNYTASSSALSRVARMLLDLDSTQRASRLMFQSPPRKQSPISLTAGSTPPDIEETAQ